MGAKIGLFVCKGNIHRSVIAEICFNRELRKLGESKSIICLSRGLQGTSGINAPTGKNLRDYPTEWKASYPALKNFQIHIPKNRGWIATDRKIVEQASVILAMDQEVLFGLSDYPDKSLTKMFPCEIEKMGLFMELAGIFGGVLDCGGKNDQERHWNTIATIDRIAEECIDTLVRLFDTSDGLTVRQKLEKLSSSTARKGEN